MTDHEYIWLEPEPPMDDDEVGRTWCQDNVYDPYDYDGNEPTLYIRNDIHKKSIAELEEGECELCGGDKLSAHICKQFAFRPDVAAAQIMRLQSKLDAVCDAFIPTNATQTHINMVKLFPEKFKQALGEGDE